MKTTKSFAQILAAGLVLAAAFPQSGLAAAKVWNNNGTDFNTAGNWTGGVPGSGDSGQFNVAAVNQPNLSVNTSILFLLFASTGTGYDLTADAGVSLTLLSTGTGANSAIGSQITSGSEIIHAPLVLGAAGGSTQTFTQAGGGTLVLNGAISSTNSVTLSLASTGTFNLTGTNSYTGTTTQLNGSTIIIGNSAAFGASTLNLTSNAGSLTAGIDLTGANKITNNVVWGANASITNSGGVNGIEFGGNVDLNGAARTINSNIGGGSTFDGIISNDGGGGLTIVTTNTSNVTLKGTNTYTGKTTISGTGRVTVSNIGNAGMNGNLGAGPIVELGTTNRDGVLAYTGSGETTDRVVNLGGTTGGATIDTTNATGALIFTSDFTATGAGSKTLILRGGGNSEIAGKIVDNLPGTNNTALSKTGNGIWILSGANTYNGGTVVSNGTLRLQGSAATLGLGNVTVTSAATKLEITTGVLNAINDGATLSLAGGGTAGIADAGFLQLGNGVSDTVAALILNGVMQGAGTYGSSTSGATNQFDEFFAGNGIVIVIPEPSIPAILALGAGLLAVTRRFRRS